MSTDFRYSNSNSRIQNVYENMGNKASATNRRSDEGLPVENKGKFQVGWTCILVSLLILVTIATAVALGTTHAKSVGDIKNAMAEIKKLEDTLAIDFERMMKKTRIVEETLSNAISQERNKTDEIVESLKGRLLHVEETVIPRTLIETCDFFYKSKCYFLLMPASRVNRPEVLALCRQQGGDLADIVDRIHFGKAVDLIRSRTFIAHSYNHIWTGMNVDVQARRIRLKNGEWAPYQRWYTNRPFTPARVAVGIHADYITNSANTGMFDEHDTSKLLGGLCEKNVN